MGLIEEHTPKYCPRCGEGPIFDSPSSYLDVEVCEHEEGIAYGEGSDFEYIKTYTYVFDCYCKMCGWSGEISPDALDSLENKI